LRVNVKNWKSDLANFHNRDSELVLPQFRFAFALYTTSRRSNGMDDASWPTDNRLPKKKVRLAKGKDKDKTKEFIRDYPYLEHGSLNALTLAPGTGRLKWVAVAHTSEGDVFYQELGVSLFFPDDIIGQKLKGRGDAQKLFPATRPYPLRIPTTSVSRRAEQGVCCFTAI
jgi:hypothetical protein